MKHRNRISFLVFLCNKCMNHISISRQQGDQPVAQSSNEVSNSGLLSEIQQYFIKVNKLKRNYDEKNEVVLS